MIDPEELVPSDDPTCRIKPLAEAALGELEPTFEITEAQKRCCLGVERSGL